MYTVLKSKRFHFEIPETQGVERESKEFVEDSKMSRQSTDMIMASCFLDDVFVLFLFNSGRYLIVNTTSNESSSKTQQKKNSTAESQIMYEGHILQEFKQIQQKSQKKQDLSYLPKKLLPKNSLTLIEESYSKVIFTDCKRIIPNECIIITKHSSYVFWLKLVKESIQKNGCVKSVIKTEFRELPNSMFGDILRLDNTNSMMNITVFTELHEFNNAAETTQTHKLGNSTENYHKSRGSFYIKNEIIEDKMIYFTVYTRIPQSIREKYTKCKKQEISQLPFNKIDAELPFFIITKFEFAIPINQVNSNFVIEVSDKFNNQIAIYKQCQDDETEWEIKLYSFGFNDLRGEDIVVNYLKNRGEIQQKEDVKQLVVQNTGYVPKPRIIILPQEFTSSIHLQQFIRIDFPSQKSNQSTYLIVSINQTHIQPQNPPQQPQIAYQQLGQAYRVNGQLVYFDQNGNIRLRQNTKTSEKCWTHVCKLTFQQNSDQFTQWIEKVTKYKFSVISFLKIININYQQKLFYVLKFAHERVNGQLYQNKLDLVSLESGKVIQKGYLSLKNYSFSPNQRYILDVPQIFSTQQDFFFHIRLLFDKKTLYMFMIENSKKYFEHIQDVNFIQTVLSLL